MSRATGKDGRLYSIEYGTPLVGGTDIKIPADGWYKIKSRASTGSGIPAKDPAAVDGFDLAVGYSYFAKKDQTLGEGDAVIPMTLVMVSFVTDITDSSQANSVDVTTQADVESGTKAYVPGAFKERTGSINGMVETESEAQRLLLREFKAIVTNDDAGLTLYKSQTRVHHFMLSRYETEIEGESAVWEYFPVIVESLQMDKPMDGQQTFNFNYRVDGSAKPAIYFNVNAA